MQNSKIMALMQEGETLAEKRRLVPALQKWEEARRLAPNSMFRAWASYNLGVSNWVLLGNGVSARREFAACIKEFEKHSYGENQQFKNMHANALENAMLCALSFEEFDDFACKLSVLAPKAPIVLELVPKIRKSHERGEAWYISLFGVAEGYYNRNDPRTDNGRYGEAKSTYHLILSNRKELRLSREYWRFAIVEFCALSARMAIDCTLKRGGDYDYNSPEEFLSILTETIPFADEYLNQNSGDAPLKKIHATLDEMVKLQRQRWAQFENTWGTQRNTGVQLQNTKTYQNKKYGFALDLPSDWKVRGLFGGRASNPEFDGPNGASLKIAIWPVSPELSPEDHLEMLKGAALKNGKHIQSIGCVNAMGKEHASIVITYSDALILKTYAINVDGTTFLVTVNLSRFPEEDYDRIVESFRHL